MAYWFHRNPLKATGVVSFEVLRSGLTKPAASQLLGELKKCRANLLEVIVEPSNEISTVENIFNRYLSLIHGLSSYNVDEGASTSDSKLRKLVRFRWTSSVCGSTPMAMIDSNFELASVCLEFAMWCMKHASHIADKSDVSMDEAKEVHTCLKKAAGIFHYVKESVLGTLEQLPESKTTDIDVRIVEAYKLQCIAEAQEVTVARAMELKHKASLISSLAYETSKLYSQAVDFLTSMDVTRTGKWRKYLEIKRDFYLAYAYCYYGEVLLTEKEQCGASIKLLQESDKLYQSACRMCVEYSSLKGPATTQARPAEHSFFKALGIAIKTRLDKSTRENGFIYFHKIPEEIPEIEKKASHGLASPQEFSLPSPHQLWTKEVYESFDIEKIPKEKAPDNEPIKPITENEQGKSSFSSCIIS
ncbi:BRO1 domain-containing protein BROX-like [Xenia sp. Carnegie-2017]|uniref:BRO1 domain-containing protein BROX-like n=1 Tax=Xenia sp. Carnegie-2017 TaxID=2897299 RepID=UPI001F03F5B9|nr:BRO1 domain-containing protein BROX-like [Xenia sp. Carnegie-2017]